MIKQFLNDVMWGDLDMLIIDTPPGTVSLTDTLFTPYPRRDTAPRRHTTRLTPPPDVSRSPTSRSRPSRSSRGSASMVPSSSLLHSKCQSSTLRRRFPLPARWASPSSGWWKTWRDSCARAARSAAVEYAPQGCALELCRGAFWRRMHIVCPSNGTLLFKRTPHTKHMLSQEVTDIFSRGGGEALALEAGVKFLGRIPIDPALALSEDGGKE